MKTLVVGGSGMIGCHIALLLAERGDQVTIGARSTPGEGSPVAHLPVILGDYSDGGFPESDLKAFDAVVFAAGQDVRHVRPEDADDAFWRRYQIDGVPNFLQRARDAGVGRAVQIGSYYHVVMPALATTTPYVHARQRADEDSQALATEDFAVCTLNPPSIVGSIPGATDRGFTKMLAWGRGELVGKVADFAPAGGTNYLSARSLAEAVAGALDEATPSGSYLVGDENYSYRDFFQLVFDLSGGGRSLDERDESHPFLPDSMIIPGRGAVIEYEPDPGVVELLGYRRHDVRPMLEEIVARL